MALVMHLVYCLLTKSEDSVGAHFRIEPTCINYNNLATDPNHYRPYAFVKCADGPQGRLLLQIVEAYGIDFEGSDLRLAISKGIPSDQPKNIRDEIITNSKKNKSASLHPLAVASSYLDDISLKIIRTSFINVPKLDSTENRKFEEQKELNEKIANAQGM